MQAKSKISTLLLIYLLLILPLHAGGHLPALDSVLSTAFDAFLSPISPPDSSLYGPMPREIALRRVVQRTERMLQAEGRSVDPGLLMEIARIVERASLEYRLPPALILSVIHTESHFRHDAVSPDGAVGLMQVQPATALHFAQQAGLPAPTDLSLYDPEVNIFLGAGYLRHLIDRFGNLKTALAAYNLGPSEVDRRKAAGEMVGDRYGREIRNRESLFTDSAPVALASAELRPEG